MRIEIVRGPSARALLSDESFLRQWEELLRSCPWATSFQGPGFVAGWCDRYREVVEPVLVLGLSRDGGLCGLLPLAASTEYGLAVAGMWHAEYKSWIATPEEGETFILGALPEIRPLMGGSPLQFEYLPPGAPTEWTRSGEAGACCMLKSHPRPLMKLGDGKAIAESLRKSGNKSKMKRLEKLGKLEFRRVRDPAEFDDLFARIVPGYNLRHGAVHGATPFLNDRLKMAFHRDMMRVPGLLHVTVMTVGDTVASFHLGVPSKKELQLGIIYHDPWLAKHSPAKLHMLFLSRMLLEEGFDQFDLTSGGDTYKERFANAWDRVHTLAIFADARDRARKAAAERVRDVVRKVLKSLKIDLDSVGKVKNGLRPAALRATLAGMRKWVSSIDHTRIYSIGVAEAGRMVPSPLVRRDNIEALLQYRPMSPDEPSRREFFSAAVARFEDEQHVYTAVEDGRLVHFGWLAERPVAEEAFPAGRFPECRQWGDGTLLPDVCMVPEAWERTETAMALVGTILRDASGIGGVERIVLPVPDGCAATRGVLEELGWKYEGSIHESCILGRRKRWSDFAPVDADKRSPAPAPVD